MAKNLNKWTGAQRLVKLYERLLSGEIVRPAEYAYELGVSRQTIYYQLSALSECGIPVVNYKRGRWTLLQYVETHQDKDDLNAF